MYANITRSKLLLSLCIVSIIFADCKKLIKVDLPDNQYTAETVYSNTVTAVSAVNSIYMSFARENTYRVSLPLGLIADEILNVADAPENQNAYIGSADDYTSILWDNIYRYSLYQIHTSLEGIQKSSTLPARTKQILTGELKFMRGWLYFLLVNCYGDVPLVLSADFRINTSIPRTPSAKIFEQIEQDLKEAESLLEDGFLQKDLINHGIERIRPNKKAATALLARVYLYQQKWSEAESQSAKVIEHSDYELLQNLGQVFLKNSRETIWALQPSLTNPEGVNSPEAYWPVTPDEFADPAYIINPFLLSAFESSDARSEAWISSTTSGLQYFSKYKQGSRTMESKEYTIVFRLAEQYLIRAEARAMQGKFTGANSAVSDLNIIRHRSGLADSPASTEEALLQAIDRERQTELFMEWGERWFNIKRRGTVNNIMAQVTPQKGGTWEPYKALFPIPWTEFQYNASLKGHQNQGYTEQ